MFVSSEAFLALTLTVGGLFVGEPLIPMPLDFSSWANNIPQGNLGQIPALKI